MLRRRRALRDRAPAGRAFVYRYDKSGLLVSIAEAPEARTWRYDTARRLSATSDDLAELVYRFSDHTLRLRSATTRPGDAPPQISAISASC